MGMRSHKALKGRQDHRQGCKPLLEMTGKTALRGGQTALPPAGVGIPTLLLSGVCTSAYGLIRPSALLAELK